MCLVGDKIGFMNKVMEERLNKANTLREEEKYGDSAKEYTEALIDCVKTSDFEGMVHALGGMSLVMKHQIASGGELFRRLTLAYAYESYKVVEENGNRISPYIQSIGYRCYGDGLLMSGKVEESLTYFEKSLEISPADRCEKGNLKAHIGGIKYKLGQKDQGIAEIREALEDIRTGDMTQYAPRVWETGCLNKLAIASALEGKKQEALVTIKESVEIARTHNLTIRLREAEEILKKIEEGRTDFGV